MNRTTAEFQPGKSLSKQNSPQILVMLSVALLCTGLAQTLAAAPQKIRVKDADEAKHLIQRGGKLIGDYGAFQVIETQDAQALPAATSDRLGDADAIELSFKRLNTRAAEVKALRRPRAAFEGSRLHLIQFAGPIKPEWRESLEQCGVKVVSYVPNNAYVVCGGANALARLQSWANSDDVVQWEGEFADEYKVHPGARTKDKSGFPQTPESDTFAIQLLMDEAANAETLALIERLRTDQIKRDFTVLQYRNLIVRIPPESLSQISAQPDVISIQPYHDPDKRDERQAQIIAGNISGGSPSGPGYLDWLQSKGFTSEQFAASGFVVDVTDSGIDNGTIAPGHFGLYQNGNPSLASRVAYNRIEGTPHIGTSAAGCDGHGNLNAHIIAGYNNASAGFPHTDSAGFRHGLGICPFVSVGSSVVFDPDMFTSPNFANLQSKAYQSGARISANSWGNTNNSYTVEAQAFDALVRDAQPAGSTFATPGNQEMVIVFAVGNRGPSANTVGSPATAKNVISVGASENVRSLNPVNGGNNAFGADGCGYADDKADNVNDIAVFSSRGPCSDGRQKPDLVAPGTHITGGVLQNSTSMSGNGLASSCFKASSICALSGGGVPGDADNFFPVGQQFYTVSSGTSHATPAVAGACALLRQYFINKDLPPPSPAMTKAYLMNSTRYMTGAGANDNFWSAAQGMGGLNLGTAFDGVPRILRDQNTNDLFVASGQARVFTAHIARSDKPVRVTLAWTDAPGSTIGNAFNNDLDLVVTVQTDGSSFKGNHFSGQFSTTGGSADSRNNVENILLPEGISGDITVTVTAANINSDGVPNHGSSLDQDFALVIYNATNTTVPVITTAGISVAAESFFPTNGAVDPGEYVTVDVALKNNGTATATNLTVTLLATNGVTSPGSTQFYGDLTADGIPTSRPFSFMANGTAGGFVQATFELSDGSGSLGSVQFVIPLGLTIVQNGSFTNAAAIVLPDSGKASLYPSMISVGALTGTVTKVTATLRGYTHSWPDDVDVLLVGPSGQKVMLMSDCGGGNARSGVNLTFDSSAASSVPDSATVTAGTYKPTNIDTTSDNFSSPAPMSPFATSLTNFNGLDPNGNWSLFVQDDSAMDGGSITQGWSLTITTSNLVAATGAGNSADVVVTSSIESAGIVGSNVSLTITVSNAGPDPAAFVSVTNTLPAGLMLAGVNPVHGTCSQVGGALNWSPGLLQPGASATLNVGLFGTNANTFTNHVTAGSTTPDPDISNNIALTLITLTNAVSGTNEPDVSGNVSNTPPTLAVIANRIVHAGRMIAITNLAHDTDEPADVLTFSLGQGAHVGASVNPTTGVFTWLTTDADANTTNNFSISVSDDGEPSLTASRSFAITVMSRPLITDIHLASNWVNVTWTTIPGDVYRLQFATNLAAPQWIAVPPDLTATGSAITHTNPFVPGTQHFYRVMLVP